MSSDSSSHTTPATAMGWNSESSSTLKGTSFMEELLQSATTTKPVTLKIVMLFVTLSLFFCTVMVLVSSGVFVNKCQLPPELANKDASNAAGHSHTSQGALPSYVTRETMSKRLSVEIDSEMNRRRNRKNKKAVASSSWNTPQNSQSKKKAGIETKEEKLKSETKLLLGHHRCNRYGKVAGMPIMVPKGGPYIYTPQDTVMATCHINNLCMTSTGEFVLFQSSDRLAGEVMFEKLNSKPWVWVQGSTIMTDRGNFFIKLVDGDLVFKYSTKKDKTKVYERAFVRKSIRNTTTNAVKEEYEPIAFAENFTIYDKPLYALKRFASGNVGHVMSEALGMITGLMMNFNPDGPWEDNHILYLDDVFDMSGNNWMGAYEYDPRHATRYSIQGGHLISKNPILQRCHQNGAWKILPAPCTNNFEKGMPTEGPVTLQACFTNFYAGHTISNVVSHPYGKESLYMNLKGLVYKNLGILPFDKQYSTEQEKEERMKKFLLEKDVIIAMNRKLPSGRHGQAIHNVDEVIEYLKQNVEKDPFIQKLTNTFKKKLIIDPLILSDFQTIKDQIHYFSNVDVYISDPGSAAYYAMFFRDDTSLFLPPTCHIKENGLKCQHSHGIKVLQAFPNVEIVDIMEINGGPIPCNLRPTVLFPDNCDVILPKELVLNSVLRAVKRRYRELLTLEDTFM
ncbi:hypothetical protein C9374_003976 [Naegleria lovaniensis]|uniref:Glycosyltransferase 61 catalytic domain-containing protein n=1 Tax=Naegleria lovaniensis TaxID=51637 RepID=A0AA88H935_NAELO|nr:uncharacterized protein C9374_003976 [Naegleria lovaniensis]KAG2394212.1 hypothetical protein C9374_003976 [Naegleria lovaniensis]